MSRYCKTNFRDVDVNCSGLGPTLHLVLGTSTFGFYTAELERKSIFIFVFLKSFVIFLLLCICGVGGQYVCFVFVEEVFQLCLRYG